MMSEITEKERELLHTILNTWIPSTDKYPTKAQEKMIASIARKLGISYD